MSINRRKFIQLTTVGSTSFAATSGLFFPKPAEAWIIGFLLRSLTTRAIFGSIVRSLAGRLINSATGPSQQELLAIQVADKEFIKQQFYKQTQLAQIETSMFWGRERNDRWGPNAGLGFVQVSDGVVSTAKLTGPTAAGIYGAASILAKQGLSPVEISNSLLPVRSQASDWCSWEGSTSTNQRACLASYETAWGEVRSRYDLQQPGPGGRGVVELIVEAGGLPRRNIQVNVKFS